MLHCFSGDAALAQDLAAGGYLISFALPVSFSSARGPRAAAAALPEGTYLVETDSPWLAPGGGEQRNEPTTALRVAAELARLRGTTPEAIASQVAIAYRSLVGGSRSSVEESQAASRIGRLAAAQRCAQLCAAPRAR